MRSLDRDRRPVWIARFKGTVPTTDSDGRLTGQHEPIYATPELFWPTVTMGQGSAFVEPFGIAENYDRVVRIDNPKFEVAEQDVLWIDNFYDTDLVSDIEPVSILQSNNVEGGGFGTWSETETRVDSGMELDGGTFEDWDSDTDTADSDEFSRLPTVPPDYVITRIGRGLSYTVFTVKRRRSS